MFKLLSAQTTKLFVRKKRQKRAKKRAAKKSDKGSDAEQAREEGTAAPAAASTSNEPEALEDVSPKPREWREHVAERRTKPSPSSVKKGLCRNKAL